MTRRPLPPDMNAKWGHLPHLHFVSGAQGGEWHSACPRCGEAGHDSRSGPVNRFHIHAADSKGGARGKCRRCGYFEWADDNGSPTGGLDDETLAAFARKREAAEREEAARRRKVLRRLRKKTPWKAWHEQMGEKERELWRSQGICDFFIDEYKLGYCPRHVYRHNGQQHETDTMTIPHFGAEWKPVNLQHRLLHPNGAGKYRQMPGLPPAIFRTEPNRKLENAVLVVEGAKKAIVVYQYLETNPLGFPLMVVAFPSKTPGAEMLGELDDCDPIYLALDPDAYMSQAAAFKEKQTPAAARIVAKLGRDRVVPVRLPVKPDDFFTMYQGTSKDFVNFLRLARKV